MRWLLLLLSLTLRVGRRCAIAAVNAAQPTRRACTFDGYYSAGAATVQPCPGALPCEPGFYCVKGQKLPCPAGTYGAASLLRNKHCSADCPAGFYCPPGSSAPIECGDPSVYCPIRSAAPTQVPQGFYSVGVAARQRASVLPCPPGEYCNLGTRYPCPAGSYGATPGLASAACSGLCPAGFYCPERTSQPLPCAAGTFGASVGLSDAYCSGPCAAGFYCPAGSITATARECGSGSFCPPGSAAPLRADPGFYVINGDSRVAPRQMECPVGSFCVDGIARLCPPGTYGNRTRLASSACAGPCAPGYFCPIGSTSATQNECGDASVFCPEGSAVPTPVSSGYFTVGPRSPPATEAGDQVVDDRDATVRFAQRRCNPGSYCVNGVRAPCPPGTFGGSFGLATAACDGLCSAGYYCPVHSISSTQFECGGSDLYCPVGSATPRIADSGYCTTGGGDDAMTRSAQVLAPAGSYAWHGVCFLCPPGRYGATPGMAHPQCTDVCQSGYYCPPGSTSPTELECGSAGVYCPQGSRLPFPVDTGFYTSLGLREECPPGRFRDYTQSTNSFFDLVTGRSPVAVNYGDYLFPLAPCVLCPKGSFKPQPGDSAGLCQPCPYFVASSSPDGRTCVCFRLPGGASYNAKTSQLHFTGTTCELVAIRTPLLGVPDATNSLYTRAVERPCEPGYFCVDGVRKPCPAGSYGIRRFETNPLCNGLCEAGYYCPLASTSSRAVQCGNANVYCPAGSPMPLPVLPGYYSIRSPPPNMANVVATTPATSRNLVGTSLSYIGWNASISEPIRDAQMQCEPGYYCVFGRKFICPAGRYGAQSGLTSPKCSGLCKRGYYCPPGSTSPTERACGSFASGAFGGSDQVCATGTGIPTPIARGYYSVGGSNMTRFFQRPCEPGFYCKNGIKRQCPAGTYGATSGLSTPECSGKCRAGYYCPSYPSPPSTSPTQFECGNVTLYCPEGTGNAPLPVLGGFFSIGAGDNTGDQRNTTRTAQQRCPRGHYCRNAIVIRCPVGTYGDEEGLTATYCKGWCPAGYYCPTGTSDYASNPCPAGSYATIGAGACTQCPPNSTDANMAAAFSILPVSERQQRCTTHRECCFFG
ncbi:TPA: hypothetical protein N0F65_012728 [Lagenidium giganteum]|uniref:Uncharacterized protein n=1 Tax=Lagenidium giganteum TaxID=4803 RepID=A0AAV2YGH7_9STRA|nr:TPA: hypothetical protein N0F65_012728 [Lagenidium giganteum]